MQILHNIWTADFGWACVAFRGATQGIEIAICRSSGTHASATCAVGELESSGALPSGFRTDIDVVLAASIVRAILSADSLAASGFWAGRMSSVMVPRFAPNSVVGSPSTLLDVRRRAQSIGAILRPCLLDSLPGMDELHEYQLVGVDWLVARSAAILADDMGLGKTAQAITALRRLHNQSPTNSALVICPKQLMANWERELRRWAPELSWSRLAPPSRWRAQAWGILYKRVHVLITNYEQIGALVELGADHTFGVVILDEAHRIRNATAQVTSDLRGISRERTWALTGTPLERASSDVWTILSTVEPRRFDLTRKPSSEESLRARARPYILRRLKREALPGLPAEMEKHETLELLQGQRQAYDRALGRFRTAPDHELLAGLNELRMLCDLEPQSQESTKLERIMEILRAIVSSGEKGVVFSHLLGPLDVLGNMLKREGIGHVQLRGEQSGDQREDILAQFDQDATTSFLLASTRVGGEGLNLVGANHVIFVNRWWNPSANNQAKDRVARMGQKRTVVIHSFTCLDTVEEVLDNIIEEKSRLAAIIVEPLVDLAGDPSILREVTSRLKKANPTLQALV